ncbi:hypothetical protein PoB_007397300 [Plakobranchus ocellatus]|uniref:Uncharacterized protein n=1 Tax=Plakobranchus ocellatus TaxID=259542 RepID=A0AAV4DTP1_9GAST|nr:hypothetical protein PoB_007397300 [Plakobranchus ocellatus]
MLSLRCWVSSLSTIKRSQALDALSGQGVRGEARIRDRMVLADLKASSLISVPLLLLKKARQLYDVFCTRTMKENYPVASQFSKRSATQLEQPGFIKS